MKIVFSEEATALMFKMFCAPNAEWERGDQYDAAGYAERKECAAIGRFVNDKLLGPKFFVNVDQCKQLTKAIDSALEEPMPEDGDKREEYEARIGQLCSMLQRNVSQKFSGGEFGVKKVYVDRIKSVMEHYSKKKAKTLLPVHWSDLEEALKGNKPSTADDVLGEDDVKEAEKK